MMVWLIQNSAKDEILFKRVRGNIFQRLTKILKYEGDILQYFAQSTTADAKRTHAYFLCPSSLGPLM